MAIPSKLKALVGKSTRSFVAEVEKGQIRRFAQAIGEEDPIHFAISICVIGEIVHQLLFLSFESRVVHW